MKIIIGYRRFLRKYKGNNNIFFYWSWPRSILPRIVTEPVKTWKTFICSKNDKIPLAKSQRNSDYEKTRLILLFRLRCVGHHPAGLEFPHNSLISPALLSNKSNSSSYFHFPVRLERTDSPLLAVLVWTLAWHLDDITAAKIQSDNKHQSGPLRSVLALPCPEYIRVEHSRSEIHIKRAVRERQEMP